MSSSMLEGYASAGRLQFKKLDWELQQISKAIKKAVADAGHDTDRNQVLGNTLGIVNKNLEMLRKLKVKDLQYDPAILEGGLLKHMDFLGEVAQKLEMSFVARGFNSRDSLQMTVYNPSQEEVTVNIPAGALFEPRRAKNCQNLVLKETTRVCVKPGERKTIKLWAFCGNEKKSSPHTDLEPTDYVLNCDLSSQSSVWDATRQFERR